MKQIEQAGDAGARRQLRWNVVSNPEDVIQVQVLEMTDELRRALTAEGVGYLPPPNLRRWRRFWNLPQEG